MSGLLHDVAIYTSGIFPFFEHASSSIRMEYLDMINRFFVPLGSNLHLILQNLVLALIPGFEEEGNDCFAKTYSCLGSITKIVGKPNIMKAVWKSMIFGGRHRLAVCNYIGKLHPREMTPQEFADFCANDPDLMLTGLTCSLRDQHTLVVRSALDIIRVHFPNYTKKLSRSQKSQVAEYILLVLLHRDMSLTRRVYQWIFAGPSQDPEDGEPSEKPSKESELVVIDAVKSLLQSVSSDSDKVASRPFKVLIHLTDKVHIMEPILEELTMGILEAVSSIDTRPSTSAARTSATQLLNLVDLARLWESILRSCERCPPASFEALSRTIIYSINHTSICAEEGGSLYGPIFLAKLFHHTRSNQDRSALLPYCIDVACVLLPFLTLDPNSQIVTIDEASLDTSSLASLTGTGIDCNSWTAYALGQLLDLASHQASLYPSNADKDSLLALLGRISSLLGIVQKLPGPVREAWRSSAFTNLVHSLHDLTGKVGDVVLVYAIVKVLIDMRRLIGANDRAGEFVILPAMDSILSHFWKSPSHPNSPMLIRELHEGYQNEIDSYLCRQMCVGDSAERAAAIANAAKLWTLVGTRTCHPGPPPTKSLFVVEMRDCPPVFIPKSVMIFLESLEDPAPEVSRAALSWFNQSAAHLSRYTTGQAHALTLLGSLNPYWNFFWMVSRRSKSRR